MVCTSSWVACWVRPDLSYIERRQMTNKGVANLSTKWARNGLKSRITAAKISTWPEVLSSMSPSIVQSTLLLIWPLIHTFIYNSFVTADNLLEQRHEIRVTVSISIFPTRLSVSLHCLPEVLTPSLLRGKMVSWLLSVRIKVTSFAAVDDGNCNNIERSCVVKKANPQGQPVADLLSSRFW